jgi:hypothetical protein
MSMTVVLWKSAYYCEQLEYGRGGLLDLNIVPSFSLQDPEEFDERMELFARNLLYCIGTGTRGPIKVICLCLSLMCILGLWQFVSSGIGPPELSKVPLLARSSIVAVCCLFAGISTHYPSFLPLGYSKLMEHLNFFLSARERGERNCCSTPLAFCRVCEHPLSWIGSWTMSPLVDAVLTTTPIPILGKQKGKEPRTTLYDKSLGSSPVFILHMYISHTDLEYKSQARVSLVIGES